jgi:hypothetical protein
MDYRTSWEIFKNLLLESEKIFIKKLSRNDHSWADDPRKHQNGVFIPAESMVSGFFPELKNENIDKPHIKEAKIITLWPITGELKNSSLKHYSNKGNEIHLTGLPKSEFSNLSPASFFIGGKFKESLQKGSDYWFLTMDSFGDDAEELETALELPYDFHSKVYSASDIDLKNYLYSELISEITNAIKENRLEYLVKKVGKLPAPEHFATNAQNFYLQKNRLRSMNFREMDNPGDALMIISRDIEYKLFKEEELRQRAIQVIGLLANKGPDLVKTIVSSFSHLDLLFLSASQVRKSRAGRSFEIHISRLLRDSNIRFEEQKIISARRPDFIMPNAKAINIKSGDHDVAIILSAKTTLRERWKQVTSEKFDCPIFLATVDDRVTQDAISDMKDKGVNLVVPESLKNSDFTFYAKNSNVFSFKTFLESEIAEKRPSLIIT